MQNAHETLMKFKEQNKDLRERLLTLRQWLKEGQTLGEVGVEIDDREMQKVDNALQDTKKLKVALVGGFSTGKTSIAAAFLGGVKKNMKISPLESSDSIEVYQLEGQDEIEIIDTPGLFGFKETANKDKYKDITKQYISCAHILLVVLEPTNPIKESHKEVLRWIFRDLGLLRRSVFVLSKFDDIVDLEEESEYEKQLKIKIETIQERLEELIALSQEEKQYLSIVALSANPYDKGDKYWLENNKEEFLKLSHIKCLQKATKEKIEQNGVEQILRDTLETIHKDVVTKETARASLILKSQEEPNKILQKSLEEAQEELGQINEDMSAARVALREFIISYLSDIVVRIENTDMESFQKVFNKEIGVDFINVTTRINNEFEKYTKSIAQSLEITMKNFEGNLKNYESDLTKLSTQLAKNGLNTLAASGAITNVTIKAARDVIVYCLPFLKDVLKFKPWEAIKWAKGINTAMPIVGGLLELLGQVLDSYNKTEAQEKFQNAKQSIKDTLETQKKKL